MTSTHAATVRDSLTKLGLRFTTLVMEEAGQISQPESLVSILLQANGSHLRRAIFIGDPLQLPPVVQHPALQRGCGFDSSLMARLLRFGVPHIQLNQQGRARAELAGLFSWVYHSKANTGTGTGRDEVHKYGDLSHVSSDVFLKSNAGFVHPTQIIDVGDYHGRGEKSPSPHAFENEGEAEMIVSTYMFMRLLNYPAERISIITTYNSQKQLIKSILARRCSNHLIGYPAVVTTVDHYQGQQNDYVLLSLVRTAQPGHMQDIRRLIVALSRARFGLYIFCRAHLFEGILHSALTACGVAATEAPSIDSLLTRSRQLQLVMGEGWPTPRALTDQVDPRSVHPISGVEEAASVVFNMSCGAAK